MIMSTSKSGNDGTSEMTLSPGNDCADVPVGLSNTQYVAQKRKMLDAVNRLRETGAQLDLDIPVIAVLGSQSAGKSSLIEAISGITLPRALGTCTRCPTECQLSHSSEPWQCVVSLHIVKDQDGKVLPEPRRIDFGDPIFEKSLVTERIRRAQCAILNPSTPFPQFLEASSDDLEERELSFSSNSVCLEIRGRSVDDLSFVDLPGLIVGGEPDDSRLVQQLAEEYICKESCIILLTIACETDFENQSAHRLAAHFDPSGARTIGVLTKPDRIPAGEEARWISKIQRGGKDGIEYFSVKNPDSQDIRDGITYEQAREKETEFFSTKEPWSNLEWLYRRRLGTDKLTTRLGQLLSSLISKRLPELQEELDRLLAQTQQDITQLPSPPSSEPISEIMKLIGSFVRSIKDLVDGVIPDEDCLIQKLRGPRDEFKKAIRQTAPYFLPLERSQNVDTTIALFLSSEEEESEEDPRDGSSPIFIDDVLEKATSAMTRELPNHYPYAVIKQYIRTFVRQWEDPSRQFFDITRKELTSGVQLLVEKHFSQYAHGHLKQGVRHIMQSHIQRCADAAAQNIDSLLKVENEPFTLSARYYSEYRSKFLGHYKRDRMRSKSSVIRNLEDNNGSSMKVTLNEVIASLAKLGIRSVEPSSLAALLPPDPMEPAIGIMADVRAYFQVAHKRFADNVPMSIDRTLLQGVTADLETTLLDGLVINGASGYERCRRLLSEPEDIVERRSELEKRRQRLLSAQKEFVELFEW